MPEQEPPDGPEEQGPRVVPFRREGNGAEARDGVLPLQVWDAGNDAGSPMPRGWLLGNSFCRRSISSLIGDGGVGKTAIRHAQAISLAIGRSLTGEHVFQRARVGIVSLEDDADELRRRILAICLHFGISRGELAGWLYLAAPGGTAGKIMVADAKGRPVRGRFADALERTIVANRLDLVQIDPFVKSHGLEENANSAIDDVMQILSDIAIQHDLAIDLSHHVAKGAADPGNAARARGASAMVNAGRLVSTATAMSVEEADRFGIPEDDRRLYVRIDPAKVNIARSAVQAQWFKLISVDLQNGTDLYPNGDSVQAAVPWHPPATWDGIDDLLNARILSAFGNTRDDGFFYSDARNVKDRAAWKVVQHHAPHKTEAQCKTIIQEWLRNGVLEEFDYINPVTRKPIKGLKVNAAKRPT